MGAGLVLAGMSPAFAAGPDHGRSVVSAVPASQTPHVMNGSVDAITQVGARVVAAGTFTSVSPYSTYANTADDVVRNRIFAVNTATSPWSIDAGFNPNLGGEARSLDTDGVSVYVAGSFGSVGANTSIRRLVKLTASGSVDTAFQAVPNGAVNEVVVRGSRLYIGGAFTSITSRGVTTARERFAVLDAATGAVLPEGNLAFTGTYLPDKGTTNIKRLDVDRAGSRLVAVGNFTSVGGQPRSQIVMLTLTPTVQVSTWATAAFTAAVNPRCATVFDTFMRDVDFSPDGSYFVVTTTGAFGGGAPAGTYCDTSTRWEAARTGAGQTPTWRDYTGGDTTYGVAVTGSAVYVGGHMRWENNPFQGDQAGPGAVPREGIAALDPVNGLPLSWNPGRSRGVGAQALFATASGLWVGSDTTRIASQTRARIAFLPLPGSTVPAVAATSLPTTFFLVTASPTADAGVIKRRSMGASGTPTSTVTSTGVTLSSTVRGAFLVNDTLYYGQADGRLYRRTFNTSTNALGVAQMVNLYDDPEDGTRIDFPIANVTGMFFDAATHRLYYTVSGDARLYYRYFTPESAIVGAEKFTAPTSVNLSSVTGLTLAGGRVFYGSSSTGALSSVAFANGQITGSPTTVSTDGTWRYRAIFAPSA